MSGNTVGERIMLSLGQAAKQTGTAKSTIHRAIKSGRLSAQKEGNSYNIDPAELFRVFPVKRSATGGEEQLATPKENSVVQIELEVLRERTTQLEKQLADAHSQRDQWQEQATRAQVLLEYQTKEVSKNWLEKVIEAVRKGKGGARS